MTRCPEKDKLCYVSEQVARLAAKQFNLQIHMRRMRHHRETGEMLGREKVRPYVCRYCTLWHVGRRRNETGQRVRPHG